MPSPGDTYVEYLFADTFAPIYFEADLKFDAAFYDEASPAGTVEIVRFRSAGSNEQILRLRSGTARWQPIFNYAAIAAHTEADTWHTVKLGYANDGIFEVDGTLSGGSPPVDPPEALVSIRVGTFGSAGTVWVRDVKIGTTFGGTELVDDPTEYELPVPVPPPPNDYWADAQQLAGNAGVVDGTTDGATDDFPPAEYFGTDPNVWYKLTAPTSGTYQFNTLETPAGPQKITVYTGPDFASLAFKAADDSGVVTFFASAGETYYIEVE